MGKLKAKNHSFANKENVKFTYSDIVEYMRENALYQIFDGELFISPLPTLEHQSVLGNLLYSISNYIRENKLGRIFAAPTGFYFNETTYLIPDLIFISNKKSEILKENYIQGTPDLIIEIISPSTAKYDRNFKFKQYQLAGVAEYWLVDPINEIVEVYDLIKGEYHMSGRYINNQIIHSKTFKNLEINVSQIWE